ncbi:MAG: hypothetical protein K0S81_3335 [Rhodospirillales bacterium]|jgi:hypothetical protein|nr:hypothetical protein [Geminicoccaceae bacterium]MDF2766341.1 hypothetical protein [Rhodospirillales bacterium]
MKLSGLIGAGSGHIPKDGTAADRLIRASSIFATATVAATGLLNCHMILLEIDSAIPDDATKDRTC